MSEPQITDSQAQELYDAAFDVCACFHADASRVMAEFGDGTNLADYLKELPNKYGKRLDRIVMQIDRGAMETAEAEIAQRKKYVAAMKAMAK